MAEYTVRLKDLYKSDVVPALQKKFQYKSSMQIPKLDKVVLNVGWRCKRKFQGYRQRYRRSDSHYRSEGSSDLRP